MFCFGAKRLCQSLHRKGRIVKAISRPVKYIAISQKIIIESAVIGLDITGLMTVSSLIPTIEASLAQLLIGFGGSISIYTIGYVLLPIIIIIRVLISWYRNDLYYYTFQHKINNIWFIQILHIIILLYYSLTKKLILKYI